LRLAAARSGPAGDAIGDFAARVRAAVVLRTASPLRVAVLRGAAAASPNLAGARRGPPPAASGLAVHSRNAGRDTPMLQQGARPQLVPAGPRGGAAGFRSR
jgi:hypothetical protein